MTSETPVEPERPNEPNQGWEELRRTAEEALRQPPRRTAPLGNRATTWLMLLLVVACVLGVGTWFIIFSARQSVDGQKLHMRTLEEKAAAYQSQIDYTNATGHMPDGVPTPPLTDAEAKELQDLERKFGVAPATRPAAVQPQTAQPAPAAESRPAS